MIMTTKPPLVISIDGTQIHQTDKDDIVTTVVLNESGRMVLKKLLGGMTRDEYSSRGISVEQANFLDHLWSVI